MAELEPITREEQYLAAAAGESVNLPKPITREEMYLYAIAQNGGGGGGGNPNTVQTITGTLDDPWGDVDFDELSEALQSGNATAIIEADATALGFGTITCYITGYFGGSPERNRNVISDGSPNAEGGTTAYSVSWTADEISVFTIFAAGTYTNALDYATLVPTTLTIIWHPLPSE